jgi:hypothetical protein
MGLTPGQSLISTRVLTDGYFPVEQSRAGLDGCPGSGVSTASWPGVSPADSPGCPHHLLGPGRPVSQQRVHRFWKKVDARNRGSADRCATGTTDVVTCRRADPVSERGHSETAWCCFAFLVDLVFRPGGVFGHGKSAAAWTAECGPKPRWRTERREQQ